MTSYAAGCGIPLKRPTLFRIKRLCGTDLTRGSIRGIVQPQCVVFTAPCPRRRTRKRMDLSRACICDGVSGCAGAATRRNREDLVRAPPLEGHDNARVLTHSHRPTIASSAFEKIVPLPISPGIPTRDFARALGATKSGALCTNAAGPCVFQRIHPRIPRLGAVI
jgi:hypothetical protein